MKPRLITEQKITPFVNKYAIYQTNEQGEKGELVAFAQQKRLAFKEKVTFYADKQKSQELFTFRAEKVMDVHGHYYVESMGGELIGSFKKEFRASLVNSTWKLMDANGDVVWTVKESNEVVAMLRRFIDFIPIIGDLGNIAMGFIRYHFSFRDESGQEYGQYKKTTLFRDHYLLSMTDEAYARLDWRIYAAFSVALDALQSR